MRLTDEQYEALKPYEHNFETAVKARWSSPVPGTALEMMHNIHVVVLHSKVPGYRSCSHCQLRLITEIGKVYLKDKKERNAVQSEKQD